MILTFRNSLHPTRFLWIRFNVVKKYYAQIFVQKMRAFFLKKKHIFLRKNL